MNGLIITAFILLVYFILGGFISASYSWAKEHDEADRIPWMSYEYNTCIVFLFWIVFVIFIPVCHGIWVMGRSALDD